MRITDAQTAALLDAAPDAMIVVDHGGKIVLVNSQAEAQFGHPREDLLGQHIEVLLPARFRSNHVASRKAYAQAPNVRPMGLGMELFALRSDGSEFPVEISLSPVETPDGILVSSAIRDITERKRLEKVLVESRMEAEKANRAKSALLAAASHDLRQPLQALSMLNSVLARIAAPGSKAAEVASIQADAVRTMSKLMNSLLDISKLESGVVKPEIQECSVAAMLERLRSQFEMQAQERGLELIVEDCNDIVRTDPALLEQAMQNLVANALRYTERGYVRLRCPVVNGQVRIEVHDSGRGIPEQEREKIFEEFYQISPRSGERREGLGLGLSIVRRIAHLLDHRLEVHSVPGEGSCFTIAVPEAVHGATSFEETLEDPTSSAPASARILILDDDSAVAHATEMMLEVSGYHPFVAATLEDAKSLAQSQPGIDAIVCDFHLGDDSTGVAAIEEIRRILGRPLPAVLVTGDTSLALSQALERAQLEDCHLLNKPVDCDKLLALLERIVSLELRRASA